jgi:predicted RNase H-like HicB family nuclease
MRWRRMKRTMIHTDAPRNVVNMLRGIRRCFGRFEDHRSEVTTPHGVAVTSHWTIRVYTEADELDGGWIAWTDDLPGCVSQGDTEEEALANFGEAFGLTISELAIESPAAIEPGDDVRSRTLCIS